MKTGFFTSIALTALALSATPLAADHHEKGAWTDLFDGKSLDGWTQRNGTATYEVKDGEWNSYRIVAKGPHIKVWINGVQVSDLTDEKKFKSHPKGFIGLQVHSIGKNSGPFDVAWRKISIKEL